VDDDHHSQEPGRPVDAAKTAEAGMVLARVRDPDSDLLARLQAYDLEAFGRTGLRTYDLAIMARAGAVFIASIAGRVVGGCQLMRVLDEPDFFYVVGLYIRPEWRGRHHGRELLRLVAEESKALAAKGLILTAAPTNVPALALNEGMGFVRDGFGPHFYGENEDRYLLRWRFPGEDGQRVAEEGL
jgi:ribosomal protein S18 acetylase RimI-like enzyme